MPSSKKMKNLHNKNISYVLAQCFLTGVAFVFNLCASKWLGPSGIGEWHAINLIATYGLLLSLGVFNGMARELPYARGKNSANEIRDVASAAFIYLCILVSVCWVVAGVSIAVEFDFGWDCAYYFMAAFLLGTRFINLFSILFLRSHQDYGLLGLHQAITAIILLIFILLLWRQPDVEVVFSGVVLSMLIASVLVGRYLVVTPVDYVVVKKLINVGFPLFFAGFLRDLLLTVDRVIILGILGVEQLGLYVPTTTLMAAMLVFPSLISTFIYPKMAFVYGQSGDCPSLFPYLRRSLKLNYFISFPSAVIIFALLYYFVIPNYLFDFVQGRSAMVVIFVFSLFQPFATSIGDYFNVIGLQRVYLINTISGFVVNAVIGYVLVRCGYGLVGVAIGTVVGLFVFTSLQCYCFMKHKSELVVSKN